MAGFDYIRIMFAAISIMLLGMVWYSPKVFGKHWMKYAKLDKKDLLHKKKLWMSFLIGFLSNIIACFVMAVIIYVMYIDKILQGVTIAFLVWLGFVATSTVGTIIWENKSIRLYLLNNAYHLIAYLLIGVILTM